MSSSSNQIVYSATDFINSIGVNAHIGVSASYSNAALMADDLQYLGVTKLRDALSADPNALPVEMALAAQGYKFDFVVSSSLPAAGSSALASYVSNLATFKSANSGSITAIEGLNEEDIQAFSWQGQSTTAAAAKFQAALYAAVKGNTTLSNVSLYNFTISDYNRITLSSGVNDGAVTDYANAHAYAPTNTTPAAAVSLAVGLAGTMTGVSDPVVITETGYSTLQTQSGLGTDETVQAKSILDTLMDAFKDGVNSTYLYELFDNNSISSSSAEAHFGLFNADGTPKLAATAVHNLTNILSSSSSKVGSTAAPNYTLGGLPASGNSMVMAKSDGAYDIVVWAEPKMWNATTQTDVNNPAQTVSVDLGRSYSVVKVYDPLSGTDPIAVYTNVETLSIALTDHPLIIDVSNTGTGAQPVAAAAALTTVATTAATVVSELSALNANTALKSITLSDSNVLPVASVATMNYMIAHYGNALSAIQGTYQFSVATSSSTWTKTVLYNASGTYLSDTDTSYVNGTISSSKVTYASGKTDTTSYTAGVKTGELIINADGSRQAFAYNITGQTYTSAESDYNAAGTMTSYTRRYTNGVVQMEQTFGVDGSHGITWYDLNGAPINDQVIGADGTASIGVFTNGIKTAEYVTNPDKSLDNYFYNLTGRNYTTEHLHVSAAGAVTGDYRYDAKNNLLYAKQVAADGSSTVSTYGSDGSSHIQAYSAAGVLLTDVVSGASGGTTSVYTAGVKTKMYVANADGTQDNYFYNIAGQSYTSEHDHVNASGIVDDVQRYYANGKLSYEQTVSGSTKISTTYSTTGVKTLQVTSNSDGITTDQYDAKGVITNEVVKGSDGSVTTSLYTAGAKTKMYVANTDKTQDNYYYNISGQSYTSEHDHINASGVVDDVQRYYANGKLSYEQTVSGNTKVSTTYSTTGIKTLEVTSNSGGTTTDQYDAKGVITNEVVKGSDGSVTTNLYTAGAKTKMYVVNADKTQDNYFYNISGQSYTSEHDHINTSGMVDTLTRVASDGSQQIKAYTSNLLLSGGSGNDIFTSAGGDTFAFSGDFGKDTINQFSSGRASGHDTIQFSKALSADFSHLSITQSGANAVISLGNHGTLTLTNTLASTLGKDNFTFF